MNSQLKGNLFPRPQWKHGDGRSTLTDKGGCPHGTKIKEFAQLQPGILFTFGGFPNKLVSHFRQRIEAVKKHCRTQPKKLLRHRASPRRLGVFACLCLFSPSSNVMVGCVEPCHSSKATCKCYLSGEMPTSASPSTMPKRR